MTDQTRTGGDIARQVANVAGAALQIVSAPLALLAGLDISAVANEHRSLIAPAGYAFVIWTPIFILSLAYAVYQALPRHRTDPLLRQIGWLTAGAYFGDAIWTVIFPSRQYVLGEILILAIWLLLAQAFWRWCAHARRTTATRGEQWLVALPLGLIFGWLTAANVASLALTLIAHGWAATGPGATLGGAALLLFGGTVASAVIVLGKRGPAAGWGAYTVAVLWALVAIVINQIGDSRMTAATAALMAVIVLGVALFGSPLVGPRWDRGAVPAAPPAA